MHGANRLGGNGVANSTVFGGIAGDVMPGWVKANGAFHAPDQDALDAAVARCRAPFSRPAGSLVDIREKLYELMWDDVGIVRDAASLARATGQLDELEAELDATGVSDGDRAFNLTWHDWLNLKNLILVSKSIRCRGNGARGFARRAFPRIFPMCAILRIPALPACRGKTGALIA